MKEAIVWGGTGNFKVVREILDHMNIRIIALFDNNPNLQNPCPEIPLAGGLKEFPEWFRSTNRTGLGSVVTIGGKYGKDRLEIQEYLKGFGIHPLNLIHPTAYVSPSAILGEGTQVYAMASVCTEAVTGKACIINTAASVDHETILEDGVFIGPGARLAGLITVGKYADIYTGAVVLPRIRIGEYSVVGAGAVVLEDVEPRMVVAGNPARVIKKREDC